MIAQMAAEYMMSKRRCLARNFGHHNSHLSSANPEYISSNIFAISENALLYCKISTLSGPALPTIIGAATFLHAANNFQQ